MTCGTDGRDDAEHERVEDADADDHAEQQHHECRTGLDGRELGRAHGQIGAFEQDRDLLEVGRAAERALAAHTIMLRSETLPFSLLHRPTRLPAV